MTGVIILPKYLKKFWTPKTKPDGSDDFGAVLSNTAPFWYAIRDAFGFELRYADEVDVPSGTDLVLMFGVPYHNRPKLIPGLLDLDKKTKLVMYPGDLNCYNNKLCLENKIKVFDRCDLIVSGGYEFFVKTYPQFLPKYKFLPLFFSPHDRYTQLNFNEKPLARCLLSGALNPKVYPLRVFIRNNSTLVDYRPAKYVGDAYAKLLHSYFCCVTCSSVFNFAVAKCFEIPATGSLLLVNETEDLKKAGFVAYKHYVPITKKNVVNQIAECVNNQKKYNHIRKEGMTFVRENHSINNRIESVKELFDGLMNK
jgi:hypothetical protein